ncbi:MAG TPA: type II toxin-antitoxin system HicA family toxin [Tepidisphaeraceae bacterium]|jgi:predicted RNA binding protein YcfA (HicA-like mRNA interferase family)|nr:type II toxin-antitoxin system HicA family toxin [Tepidisphaeraceae bacterium]
MPKLAGVNYQQAIRAFERLGYRIKRQGKHIIMSNGETVVVIPRNNPINGITMGIIIRDAGLTVEEFKKVL